MRSVRGVMTTPRWLGVLGATIALAVGATGVNRLLGLNSRRADKVAEAKLAMSRLPLLFEKNEGQAHGRVKFMSRGAGYNFFITPTASYLALARLPETSKFQKDNQKVPKGAPGTFLKMELVDSNPKAKVVQEGDTRGRSNYFIGNDRSKWVTDVPSFSRVRCEEVYPGVDLVYYGNQQELEHDFVVAPGAAPDKIQLKYDGAKNVQVSPEGELVLRTGNGELRQKRPIAYQMVSGRRRPVEAEYTLLADNQVGFRVGAYDPSQKLVIDPVIRYCTYIGGSTDDYAFDIKLDQFRNAYMTGYTGSFLQNSNGEPSRTAASNLSAYPTQNPLMGDPDRFFRDGQLDTNTTENPNTFTYFDSSRYDAFVTRLNATGTGPLVYSTYLGAEDDDYGMAIATSAGRVTDTPYIYVTGITESTAWPLQAAVQSRQSFRDAFVVKIDASRSGFSQLVFSTYLGGSGDDSGRAIAVDGTQNVYVAGITTSSNLPTFSPTGNVYQPALAGATDIFLVSLNASGSAYNYYTYFGGTGDENGLPNTGVISDNLDYRVANSPFVNAGNANPVSTPLGRDVTVALTADSQGFVYVAGGTTSDNLFTTFPPAAQNGAQASYAGGVDGFVAKFDPSGQPVFGTYLGGGGDDACRAVAVNGQGQAYVTGFTNSGDFPTQAPATAPSPAFQSSIGGGIDAFVTKFTTSGGALLYSTYLGGSGEDIGNGIAVSPSGQAYVAGITQSPYPTFPLVNPSQNDLRFGSRDVFISKLRPDGNEFEYSTYLGGSSTDRAMDIAVDDKGQAYVAGITESVDLPTSLFTYQGGQTGPLQDTYVPSYAIADVFVVQPHSPPFAPSNLIATDINRTSTPPIRDFVSLAWTDNSDNEEGFEIERKLGNAASTAPFEVVGAVGTDQVTHTDNDSRLTSTTTYTYRVRPFNTAVIGGTNTTFYGPYSNQLEVTTLPSIPASPTNLTVTPIDTSRLKLDWADNANNEASYKIERRKVTPPSTSFAEIVVILSDAVTGPGTGARTYTDNNGGAGLLANTTYEYRIRSSNVAGDSPYLGPVAGKTLPNAPTIAPLLSVAAQTNSRIDLQWTYDNNDQVGFKIYRAAETSPGSGVAGPYTLIRTDTQTTALTSPPFNDVYTFSDPGLGANTTLFYQVRSYNQSGDGPLSNEVSATTLPDPPTAADDLDVILVPGTTDQVQLSWDDNSLAPAEESGFKIERSFDGVSGWTLLLTTLPNTGTGRLTQPIGGLQRNTVYYYRVIAFTSNPSGDSDALPSNVDCALTLPVDASGLTATPVSQSQINLSWTDNNPTATPPAAPQSRFRIERSPDGSTGWASIGTLGPVPAGGVKNFPATGLTQNTQYYFRVRTFNVVPDPGCSGGGDSPADSEIVNAFTLPGSTGTVTVTNIPPTTNLRISFTDANQPASTSQHLIERAESATGPWTTVVDLPAGVTTYDDTDGGSNLDGNFTFFYRVTAHNSSGSAAPSTAVGRLTLPAAATNLTVAVPTDILNGQRRGRTQLDLTWTDNSRVPTQFDVERSLDGVSGWTVIGTAAVGASSYTDTNLTENTMYCYRVFGRNASGRGDISSPLPPDTCATTLKVPPTGPTGLTATVISTSQINLQWTDTALNEEYYRIDRKIGVNGAYSVLVPMLAANSESYQDTGLQPDTTYTYIVYAVNNGGESLPSREAGGTTLKVAPAAPTGLSATAVSATSINVQWSDNANNETAFELERTPSGGSATVIQLGANNAANPVSYNDTGLAPNTTYSYRVRAKNNNFSTWDGPATATTYPANPSGLTASAQSPTRIHLQWTDNNGSRPSGNRILRRAAGEAMFTVLVELNSADGTSYNDDTVASGTTYTYVVFATNTEHVSAQGTNEASATTPAVPPAAPIDLVATANSSSSILLTWTDKANNETLFKIERSTDGTTFRQIATRGSSAGVDQTVTHTDQGLVAGMLYVYRVRAANGGGDSNYSNTDDATTLPIPPGAPSALTATALSTSSIRLDWTDGSSNEAEFRIQRKNPTTGNFDDLANVVANVVSYTDTGLAADTLYEYRIFARNGGGDSGFSNLANARTFPNPPTAPANFVATPQSQSSIQLTWQDNSTNETSFRLSRSSDNVAYSQLVVLGPNVTNYTDQGLITNTQYFYRLVAINAGGDSTPVDANAFTHPNPPTPPTTLTATALSQTSIRLNWFDGSSTETGFRVERRTANGQFAAVGTAPQNATSFTDTTGLVANTAYTYRIAAVNNGGSSTFSNDATVATLPNPPAAPSNLTVTVPAGSGLSASAVGSTRLVLNWQDNSDNETMFVIERRTASTSFAQVGTAGANETTFPDQNLSPNTTYFYQVKASNTGGNSAASAEASGTTLPNPPGGAPQNLTATAISSTQIRLNWTEAIPDESGFNIERSTSGTGSYTVVGSKPAGATQALDEGLTPNTTYFYRVRAINTGGPSAEVSETASATTRPNAPEQVTGLLVEPLPAPDGSNALTISWDDVQGETSYRVERKVAGNQFNSVATTGQNENSFVHTGLNPATTYTYRVIAINSGGESTASTEASGATLPNAPEAPSGLVVVGVDATQLRILWQDNSNNEDGFRVYRVVDGNLEFADATGANSTSTKIGGLTPGVVHTFRVTAFNAGGESEASAPVSGVTPNSGRLRVSTAALNFGTVAQGNSKTRSVRLTNIGNGPLQIGYSLPEGPYSVEAPTTIGLMLQPRQSVEVIVRFTPTARGRSTRTLLITSSDVRKPRANVRLVGVGGAVRK